MKVLPATAVPDATDTEKASPSVPRGNVVDSQSLFHGEREVWIEHEGERYRLRITRRGKLILQK